MSAELLTNAVGAVLVLFVGDCIAAAQWMNHTDRRNARPTNTETEPTR